MLYSITYTGHKEPTLFSTLDSLYSQAQRCVDYGEPLTPCVMRKKATTAQGVVDEFNRRIQAWRDKKELTHKKIWVDDGVSGVSKKAVWIRRGAAS